MNNDDLHPLIPQESDLTYRHLRKRHAKEKRFRLYGIGAIALAGIFLVTLLISIIGQALPAFRTTEIRLNVYYEPAELPVDGLAQANYQTLLTNALKARFPEAQTRKEQKALTSMLSDSAKYALQEAVEKDPKLIGKTEQRWVLASSKLDMAYKNRVKGQFDGFVDSFEKSEDIRTGWNTQFWTQADSREPEQAGILGGFVGSILVIIVCMGVALPVGVAAAVYMEEFAKKNRVSDLIEINLNNLAAVPSIVYGLLALALFLHGFGMPRSSPLVGGLALALLVMPVIIIATRQALQSVPPSLRDAAIAVGASPVQVVFHHTLPAALPGIMTGTILAVARALGETAPLLMIGMVAFIASVPTDIFQPAAALPVQVFLWSDSSEPGFREKTAAAILVLLAVLVILNMAAVMIRKKFERKW